MYTDGPRIGPRLGDAWQADDFDPSSVVPEEDSPQSIPQDDPLTQLIGSLRFYRGGYVPRSTIYVSQPQQTQFVWTSTMTWLLIAGGLLIAVTALRK